MNTKNPYVSVIIAVLNEADTLSECLDSVISQSYNNIEIIVIDGGSTDGSQEIIRKYLSHIAYFESSLDQGIYQAWNKALAHRTGDWVCFLGADDRFFNHHVIKRMHDHLCAASNQHIRYVYAKTAVMSKQGSMVAVEGDSWEKLKKRHLQFPCINHAGTFHHKDLFLDQGSFDESFKIAGDYEFLLRELKNRDAYFAEDTIITAYRIGGVSRNLDSRYAALKEAYRARNLHVPGISWTFVSAFFQITAFLGVRFLFGNKVANRCADTVRRAQGKLPIWSV